MILNIKESLKGQYTFQKPAWRDECQFLPITNNVPKNGPLAWGPLLCKSHFTGLFQHGKSLLLWEDIQASHSVLAWQKHILEEDCQQERMGKGHRMLMLSVVTACPGLWEAAAGLSILRSLEPGALWAWEASAQPYTAQGGEQWVFQLPLLIRMAALASGTWEWDMPTIIETSRGLHILLWPLPFSPCFYPILGTKKPRTAADQAYNWHSSSQLNTPDVLPVPKGSHCVRGFLLNRTKQNSEAVGLLGCWRETMGKQNSGRRDIYFSEGHGCLYTIPFKALWSFSNTIQSCSQAEIQRVRNLFIPSLI